MSVFRRSRPEPRSLTASASWATGGDRVSLDGSMTGALGLTSLYSAVTLVLDAVTAAPVQTFSESGDARKRIPDPPIVRDPGPPGVKQRAWIEQALASLLLRGNAIGYAIGLDSLARPTAVKWLHPDSVRCDESRAEPRWFVNGKEVDSGLIVHIPGHVLPGSIMGLSPLGLFRKQIEQGQQVDASASEYYRGVRNPRGLLMNKSRTLNADEVAEAKERYKASMSDHDILVTGNDWAWQSLSVTPGDAQFIEAAKMTANQVAAIYHVPPEDIGGVPGASLTYATLESNAIKLQQRAILPWTQRLEAEWSAMLASPRYVRFNLNAALRVDFKTRMDGYGVALKLGILTLDEVRAMEERPGLTPEQVTEWQENYVKSAAAQPVPDAEPADPAEGDKS